MPKIFISYRRDDSEREVRDIYLKLGNHFDKENVFVDVDNIPAGVDFRDHLAKAVNRCDVVLVIIGKHWLNSSAADGSRRLDDEQDFVRIEVEAALERGVPVIPVLLFGAKMPSETVLPASMRNLAYRNAIQISLDDYQKDLRALVDRLWGMRTSQREATGRRREEVPPQVLQSTCKSCHIPFEVSIQQSHRTYRCQKCGADNLPPHGIRPVADLGGVPDNAATQRKLTVFENLFWVMIGLCFLIPLLSVVGLVLYSLAGSPPSYFAIGICILIPLTPFAVAAWWIHANVVALRKGLSSQN